MFSNPWSQVPVQNDRATCDRNAAILEDRLHRLGRPFSSPPLAFRDDQVTAPATASCEGRRSYPTSLDATFVSMERSGIEH